MGQDNFMSRLLVLYLLIFKFVQSEIKVANSIFLVKVLLLKRSFFFFFFLQTFSMYILPRKMYMVYNNLNYWNHFKALKKVGVVLKVQLLGVKGMWASLGLNMYYTSHNISLSNNTIQFNVLLHPYQLCALTYFQVYYNHSLSTVLFCMVFEL